MRLIRLPYSLHGMISRIVIPINVSELEKFNPVFDERCIPTFLNIDISSYFFFLPFFTSQPQTIALLL